ncbi:MAG: SMP-30/gluconolactonase/LRE family protein [Prosthecobacter sp.]|jgi:gluconolactonase|uniref:SMP-30/gluconolactonase/LRE family protein n=1 Tax=Prosthecobacter sp. TaxID=1965333 RepID=UPI0019E71A21|nr:SMP-30/gluconolactonase/LRE family protein [Prosthecobacter sp.]MBE2283062.1 SMP-30/gluconolactonase/LRE family protein [Prosthecobacter sp.]
MTRFLLCLLFASSLHAIAAEPVPEFKGSIERLDAGLDALIAPGTKIEVLASGFNWSEGPVWRDGGIVFSDVPENTVFGWKEGDAAAKVVLKPSGSLSDPKGQGSNGLAVDAKGNLVLCQHGERRVARLEKDGSFTPLADKYDGKRFNSPNDLVIAKSGTIYFTDPPYGLKGGQPELPFHGIYSVTPDGKVSLLVDDVRFPNGIALSPDEKTLYIAVSDPQNTRVMAYDLQADGSAKKGRVFFHAQPLKSKERKGGCDGMKVDTNGNIWTTGPGGVLVISKEGKHLGTILTGQATANCAFGGEDRGTLYITADMFLLRVKTLAKGL